MTARHNHVDFAVRDAIEGAVRRMEKRSVVYIKAVDPGVMEARVVTKYGKTVLLRASLAPAEEEIT